MLKYPSVQSTKGQVDRAVSEAALPETSHSVEIKQRRFSTPITDVLLALKNATIPATEKRAVLNWKEFFCISFILETPLFQVVNFIDLIIKNGGILLYLAYLLFSITVAMPIFTFILFCGNYTKKGYIMFWEMVPILKGMAWSVSIFSIFLEFFNISIGGLALLYIPNLLNAELPWSNCNFKEATNRCYPMFPTNTYDKTCIFNKDNDATIHFPAYEYFLYNKIHAPILSKEYESTGELQVPWAISVCITWFTIFILLILGFDRFRTVICHMGFTFAVIFFIPTLYLTIFVSRGLARPSFMEYDFNKLLETEFWIYILTHSLTRKLPGNYVVLGSHAPASMKPNLNIFCIYGMKYVCFMFLMVWISTTVQILQLHYKVNDINCIPVTGLSLVFAIIPDMFTRFPILPHLPLFLYFFGLWFFGMLSALYTINAFCESVIEVWPGIFDMKIYFCAILCFVCCLFNMTLLTSLHLTIMETWAKFGFTYVIIILLLIFTFAIFIYSGHKYGNDYYFLFGKPLGSYWTQGLKTGLFVSLLCFSLAISNNIQLEMLYPSNTFVFVWCHILIGVILAPILYVAVSTYLKYKNKGKAVKAIIPTADWGPPSIADKQIRSRFNPKREIRIKNEVQKCRHNCLLNSQKIKEEIDRLQLNRSRLVTSLGVTSIGETSEEIDY